jgi:flagellar biosynthesis/type III secretory pathway M-ring protein FliF/YscJ
VEITPPPFGNTSTIFAWILCLIIIWWRILRMIESLYKKRRAQRVPAEKTSENRLGE